MRNSSIYEKLIFCPLLQAFVEFDSVDVAMGELRTVVETASRNGQRVLVDDFTGLTCPYCGYASFAVSDMLDEFPGIGGRRKAALLKHFGSVKKLKKASLKEIAEVQGFGLKTAQALYEFLGAR